MSVPGTSEFLLGKLAGQLEGIEHQLARIEAAMLIQSERHDEMEKRIGRLERYRAHQTGVLAAISALMGLLGAGLMTWLTKGMK